MEGRRRPDRDRYSTDTGSFITRSSARNLWRHVGPLGSYRRKPFIGFFLHPFIPRAEVLCNLRRLWGLAAIKWSAVFGRVGPFSNAIRHKHLPRRYLWSQLTLLTRQGSSFWCRRLFGREWGDNDCRAGCGKGGWVGKHISVLIMCHSQSWEMLRKQSGELCELPSYQLCQLFSNVSRGRDTHIAAREIKTGQLCVKGLDGWEPSLGWESKYPQIWIASHMLWLLNLQLFLVGIDQCPKITQEER